MHDAIQINICAAAIVVQGAVVVSFILHVSAHVLGGGGGRGTRDHYQQQQHARTMALRVNYIQINLTAEIYNKLFKFGEFYC